MLQPLPKHTQTHIQHIHHNSDQQRPFRMSAVHLNTAKYLVLVKAEDMGGNTRSSFRMKIQIPSLSVVHYIWWANITLLGF